MSNDATAAVGELILTAWSLTLGWIVGTVVVLLGVNQAASWVRNSVLHALHVELEAQRHQIVDSSVTGVNTTIEEKLDMKEAVSKAREEPG